LGKAKYWETFGKKGKKKKKSESRVWPGDEGGIGVTEEEGREPTHVGREGKGSGR